MRPGSRTKAGVLTQTLSGLGYVWPPARRALMVCWHLGEGSQVSKARPPEFLYVVLDKTACAPFNTERRIESEYRPVAQMTR